MSIGGGIALIVLGLILVFALDIELSWIDIDLVGYVLIGAGVLVTLLGLIFAAGRRRRSVVRQRTEVDGAAAGHETVTERETRDSL